MNETAAGKKKNLWLSRLLSSDRWSGITVPVLCIIFTLIVSSILLIALGKNPVTGFLAFLQGSGFLPKPTYGAGQGMLSDLFSFLGMLAPMILSALAFVAGFKAGLFNIGISGQMLASGFLATVLIGYADMSPWLSRPLVILVGILVGTLLGAFVGFLKYKFNIHEVVSTIMINYIIQYLCAFFINTYYMNPVIRSTRYISKDARLTLMNLSLGDIKINFPIGIIIALIAAPLLKFLFDRTRTGLEIKAVGSNNKAARYAGIGVGRRMVLAMALSGMMAGLAGVCYYCGYYNTIAPNILPSMGYDGITVALLGNSSPVGCIFAGGLVSIFSFGSNYMSSTLGVPKEIASLITGILLLFSACGAYFQYMASRRIQKQEEEEDLEARAAKAASEEAAAKVVAPDAASKAASDADSDTMTGGNHG